MLLLLLVVADSWKKSVSRLTQNRVLFSLYTRHENEIRIIILLGIEYRPTLDINFNLKIDVKFCLHMLF